MPEADNLGTFFTENKKLVKEYLDIRLDIYKLKLIRLFAKSAGNLIWILISLFLLLLFSIFLGLVGGFWLSDLTGSYVKGFGIITLIILLKVAALAAFRKALFINPIIRGIVRRVTDDEEGSDEKQNKN